MNRHLIRLGLVLVLVGATTRTAGAWGNRGHEVVALIAYNELAAEPETQGKIQALLKKHPHYDTYLAKGRPKGVELEHWVVMRAATWSDWVRNKPDYHRPTWHYVNKPLVLDATPAVRLKIEKAFSSTKENHGDVLIAFPDCRRVVRNAAATDEDRAVRLCWLFHLVGDIHQPLHAVAYCDKDLPAGDRGGNAAWLRRKEGRAPTRLHALWDHLLDGNDADATARSIQMSVTATPAERKVADIGAWAEESYDTAKASAYAFNGQPLELAFETDRDAPSDVPVLPDGYEEEAVKAARKRALLAGLRLADVLKADLKE